MKKKNADSKSGVIRAVIYFQTQRIVISTGVSVDADKWDAKNQRVTKSTKMANAQRANRLMESYRNTLDTIMAEYEVREAIPTADAISHRMNEALKGESASPALSVAVAMEDFVREEGNLKNWSVSTAAKFHTLQRQTNAVFGEKRLWELEDKDLTDLVDWYKANGHNNTSIQRRVKQMRWFLRWAHNKGLYKGNLHETFRPKFKEQDKGWHSVFAIICAVFATLWQFLHCQFWEVPLFATVFFAIAYRTDTLKLCKTFWLELTAFCSTFLSILICTISQS